MVRSRSRSPRRVAEKRRSRSRDRERERDRERRRHHRSRSRSPRRRSRSNSPRRRRSPGYKRRSSSKDNDVVITGTSHVSPSQIPNKTNRPSKAAKQTISVPDAAMEGKSEEEIEMMKLMGFGGFDSTKGKHVPGTDVSASNVIQKRKYRQYMNRRGGFNRPLDFIA